MKGRVDYLVVDLWHAPNYYSDLVIVIAIAILTVRQHCYWSPMRLLIHEFGSDASDLYGSSPDFEDTKRLPGVVFLLWVC